MDEREELKAAIAARRELGEELEPQVIDAFLERIEKRLEERKRTAPALQRRGANVPVTIVSLCVAIPLIGIAGGTAGLAGVIAVCVALVLIVYFARD